MRVWFWTYPFDVNWRRLGNVVEAESACFGVWLGVHAGAQGNLVEVDRGVEWLPSADILVVLLGRDGVGVCIWSISSMCVGISCMFAWPIGWTYLHLVMTCRVDPISLRCRRTFAVLGPIPSSKSAPQIIGILGLARCNHRRPSKCSCLRWSVCSRLLSRSADG